MFSELEGLMEEQAMFNELEEQAMFSELKGPIEE